MPLAGHIPDLGCDTMAHDKKIKTKNLVSHAQRLEQEQVLFPRTENRMQCNGQASKQKYLKEERDCTNKPVKCAEARSR